jgi:hypothetical protein
LGFRKDNPNVFNMLVQDLPIASGIKCIVVDSIDFMFTKAK